MTEHRPHRHEVRSDRPELGYEATDASPKVLAYAFIGLSVLIILVFIAMWLAFIYLDSRAQKADNPRDVRLTNYKPPEPRLQAKPVQDLNEMRKHEQQLMDSYGWLNQASGIVRIPVSRAMDIVAQKGLPDLAPLGGPDATLNPFANPQMLKTPVAAGTDSKLPPPPGGGPPGPSPQGPGSGSQAPTPSPQK